MIRKLVIGSLMALAASTVLVGCGGGGGGSDGVNSTPVVSGVPPTTSGFLGITNASSPVVLGAGGATPNANGSATPGSNTTWANLAPEIGIDSITINSPPVIKFRVSDGSGGHPVLGLGSKAQSATATVASLQNLKFTLAKLVPGTNGGPSKWVSVIVTRPPTVLESGGTIATDKSCSADHTVCGTYPTADVEGTLVDNGDGSYQYTFYRDVKNIANLVNSLVDNGNAKKADLDPANLVWDPTATYRIGIEISGYAPGTNTNTPTAAASSNFNTKTYTMAKPANLWYDFRPDGTPVTQTRQIVSIDSCAECHNYKGIGHFPLGPRSNEGNALVTANNANNLAIKPSTANNAPRKDPNYCVTCHTDQTKYSFAESDPTTVDANGYWSYKRLNGQAAFTFPRMIHQTHMGEDLVVDGYNLNGHCVPGTAATPNTGTTHGTPGTPDTHPAQCYDKVKLPQDQRDCLKCHNGSATIVGGTTHITRDGDNWKNKPNSLACGACHDGINFADGTGSRLSDKQADLQAGNPVFTTRTGHGGGAQPNDSLCASCHTAAAIPVSHAVLTPTPHNPVAAVGVSNFSWDIRSFTINASRQPVITFRIMKDGQAVTQLAAATTVVSGVNGQTVLNPTFQPIPNFVGGPSLYLLMSMPQDGIANPADWNATASVALGNLLIPSGSPKQGSLSNTLSGGYYLADANGYFTATLTGDLVGQPVGGGCTAPVAPATQTSCVASAVSTSPITVPASATLVTAAVLGSFTQINVTGYPYVAADYSVNNVAAPNTTNSNLSTPAGIAPAVGGLTRPGLIALLTAPGYTGRRVAVDSARCNNCHDQLGTSPAYHGQAQWEAGKSGRTIAASPGAVKGAGSTQTGGSQPFVKGTSPRNNAVACSICHLANRVDSAGWSADVSTWFHGIHGASKRTTPFTVTAASATDNYSKLIFPGLAKNCSNCHVPNAVNFGTVSSVGGAPSYTVMTPAGTFTGTKNLLWTTAATGRIPTSNTFATSYYAWAGSRSFDGSTSAQNYGSGFSYSVATGATTAAATTTLVNSPIASACFACHDDNTAAADGHLASIATASGTNYVAGSATSHIITFGGVLYKPRSTAGGATLSNTETCLNCHGAGQAVDAALAHEH